MNRFFPILLFLFTSVVCSSQNVISIDSVSTHIGDSVNVCSKVFSTRFVASAENTPTFLNLGAGYPNQKLTLVIWADVRKKFANTPEDNLKDKSICVTGKLELYRGQPQIVIKDPSQIRLQ
jgi:DNA/RNA endonuclease YhcR with UshA esterase domain